MTTIEFSPSPLPRKPAPYEEWREDWRNYLSVYDIVLNAERYAVQLVEANSSDRNAKENTTFARVAGYLLVELYNRRTILSEEPCISLVKQLISPSREPGDVHDVVFKVGERLRNHLVRLCASDFFPASFSISVSLQFGQRPRGTPHLLYTLRVPRSTRWRI